MIFSTKGIFSKKNDCLSAKLKWRNSPFLLTFAPISRLWLKTREIIARKTSLFLQGIFFVSRISIDEFPLFSKITWVGKNYTPYIILFNDSICQRCIFKWFSQTFLYWSVIDPITLRRLQLFKTHGPSFRLCSWFLIDKTMKGTI